MDAIKGRCFGLVFDIFLLYFWLLCPHITHAGYTETTASRERNVLRARNLYARLTFALIQIREKREL